MPTTKFKASTQYNDWVGTSAADNADQNDFRDWLLQQGHMQQGEFLVGLGFFAGENHGTHQDPISCFALFAQNANHDTVKNMIDGANGPVQLRRVDFDMDLADFFGKFKR